MKGSTYKWIIGCLLGVIVVLTSFLVTKEIGIIRISFSECLSVAATLSSLILSVIAMLYTYYSGRDSSNIYSQIENSVNELDAEVLRMSEEAKANSEVLKQICVAMTEMEKTTSEVLDTLQQGQITEQEKKAAIESIQNTKSSMLMFLERMK